MNVSLKSVARKIVYIVATLIILVSLLVIISRALTPILDNHRADFEKWASEMLQAPVTIEKVRVSWYQYQPEIELDQVTLLSKETKEPVLQIENIKIFFSILQSLWQRKPIACGLMISGADVNVHENKAGEIEVQGFPHLGGFKNKPYKKESKFTELVSWLSAQPRLVIRDIDVSYTEFSGRKRYLTLFDLSFENKGSTHDMRGKAILHQEIPIELTIAARWLGNTFDLETIKAKIYIYVSGFSIGQWLKDTSWQGWQINHGIGSAKIWMSWTRNSFKKVQSTFQLYDLKLYSNTDKSTHNIRRISGDIGWKRQGNDYVFAGDNILLDLPEHLWPVTSFYLSLSPDANQQYMPKAANLGYLDLHDIQPFLFSSPAFLPDNLKKIISQLNMTGSLQNAAITFSGLWNDWRHISLNAHLMNLGFMSWQKMPGVSNLSGMVKWNGTRGDVTLNSSQAIFKYDAVFLQPINLQQLTGDILWHLDNNTLELTIPALHVLNADLAANINGSVTIAPNASPIMNMNANFTMQKASHITRYLPMRTYDKDAIEWLNDAFISGEVQSGNAVVHGPILDFPFDNGNGTFLISGKIQNVNLHYAKGWPNLKNVSGIVTFSGRQMLVDIDHAQMLDMPIGKVHGEIPYFGDKQPQILKVQTIEDVKADFSQALAFVHASSLENKIGKIFANAKMSGPIRLKLGLTVPLSHPDDAKVQGNININEATMDLVPWNLKITKLNGLVHFTENATDAKNLEGLLFGKPLQLNLTTLVKSKDLSIVRAGITTKLSVDDVEAWLKLPATTAVKGSANVTGVIDFSLHTPIEIKLRSDLVGIELDLVDEYAKTTLQKRKFSADIIIQDKQPLKLLLGYDNILSAALILDRKLEKFSIISADLRLGKGVALWPVAPGLYISGDFDVLDWEKIKGYINKSGNTLATDLTLRKIDVRAKRLNVAGQRIDNVQLQVTPSNQHWGIQISSQKINGQLQVPVSFNRDGTINAQFTRLNLSSSNETGATNNSIDVKSLPSINFNASNVSYNDMPLGQISFKTAPAVNGLSISSFRIQSPRLDLQATGDWLQTGNRYKTNLQGAATSRRVSDLLNSFGLDAHNFISNDGKVDFNLMWNDAPYAPSLANINGKASFKLSKGRIVEVSKASGAKMDIGRMLSIFSLQTIPRRLSFDFSDVFQSGYSFDTLTGDFTFEEGDAYTNNTVFNGPVAKVGIYGRIGMENKDYDFTLTVTPYVTSSLPVAAALITGPVGGLAALAVNSVISPVLSKATTYYYSVRGPWNNPSWESVNVSKRK